MFEAFKSELESVFNPEDRTVSGKERDSFIACYWTKYQIARLVRPSSILEFGVRCGYSAWAFLRAAPCASYWGVDPYNGTHGGGTIEDGFKDWAEQVIGVGKIQRRTIAVMESQITHPLNLVADFYHIDGDHSFEGCTLDLNLCYAAALPGARLLVDDYDFIPEVRSAVDQFVASKGGKAGLLHIRSFRGDALITKFDSDGQ